MVAQGGKVMATPQTVTVAKSSLPGGMDAWIVQSFLHLQDVVRNTALGSIAALLVEITQDADNIYLNFADTLSGADMTSLLALCQRANDYLAVLVDGSTTDVGSNDPNNFPDISKPAGLLSASTIVLQMKDGAANNLAPSPAPTLRIQAQGYMTIDTPPPLVLDSGGRYTMVTGAELVRRGTCQVFVFCGTLPVRVLNVTFT
jgi:hypothetical protein